MGAPERRVGRVGLAATAVVLLTVLATAWAGSSAPTPDEIAAAGLLEMSEQHDLAMDRMSSEYLSYAAAMDAMPVDARVPKAFKLFSNECKKLDSIARGGVAKVGKAASRCIAKLQRAGAEQALVDDVTDAREAHIESLAVELRGTYQMQAAEALSAFVQSN